MKIQITNFELSNYRSCKKTSIRFKDSLSTLIGANGSGKTNFLNGILLLKRIARAPRRSREDEFGQSTCKIKATFKIGSRQLPFEATTKYTTSESNVDEVTSAVQTWNFKEFTGEDKSIRIHLSRLDDLRQLERIERNRPRGASKAEWRHYVSLMEQRYLGNVEESDPSQLKTFFTVLSRVSEFVTSTAYYSASQYTDPSRCPTYFEIESEKGLRRGGRARSEHLQFMYDLYLAYKNPKSKYQEFLSIVGSNGIGLIDKIEYSEIKVPSSVYEVHIGGKVISKEIQKLLVIPNFLIRRSTLSPNQLSEGTFKTLAIVFYLVTDTSRLLLLEEPEVCIHHGLLASILELVKDFARKKQVILSTHSDFILDALDPEDVYIVRNDIKRGTVIKPVPKSMSARDYRALREYLNRSGNLGEYWRHGELET